MLNGINETERQLYTEQIETLKSEVTYLKSIIEFMKTQLEHHRPL